MAYELFPLLGVIEKPAYPADGTPGGMTAAARLCLRIMGADLTSIAEPLQELRIFEEGYRATVRTMGHVTILQLKDGRPCPTGTI